MVKLQLCSRDYVVHFVSCIGTQEPIGLLEDINPEKWVEGVNQNSLYQIAAFLYALPYANNNIVSVTTSPLSNTPLTRRYIIKVVQYLIDEVLEKDPGS